MPSTARSLIAAAGGLASRADLARRWGVSGQRVCQLAEPEAGNGFPRPVGYPNGDPCYLVDECDEWRRSRVGSA